MYFFYIDESGSRDPSVGTKQDPQRSSSTSFWPWVSTNANGDLLNRKYLESQARVRPFPPTRRQRSVRAFRLRSQVLMASPRASSRSRYSPFLAALDSEDLRRLVETYYDQLGSRNAVILASVIDKRHLRAGTTHDAMHRWAYEFLLERIEHYMRQYHRKHQALIVMDDTSIQLNRFIAMQHAALLRRGNPNMQFPHIVEFPFFSRSELSNGVQLADLLAYNVYRAYSETKTLSTPTFRSCFPCSIGDVV